MSKNPEILSKCIKGIVELFYPLTCDVICIPNLPESMKEYVNMCGQCVIGLVKEFKDPNSKAKDKDSLRSTSLNINSSRMNDEVYVENFDIMRDNSC